MHYYVLYIIISFPQIAKLARDLKRKLDFDGFKPPAGAVASPSSAPVDENTELSM